MQLFLILLLTELSCLTLLNATFLIFVCISLAWAEAGLFPKSELMNLRKIDSDLEGHPTPRLNFIDVATGSLGQGLSVAAGMAYVGKNIDKASYR